MRELCYVAVFADSCPGLELRVETSKRSCKWWPETEEGEKSIKIVAKGPIPVGKEMTVLTFGGDLSSQYMITSKWKRWWKRTLYGRALRPQDFVLAHIARGATVLPHPSWYDEENVRIRVRCALRSIALYWHSSRESGLYINGNVTALGCRSMMTIKLN